MTFFDIPESQGSQPSPTFGNTKSHLDEEWEDEKVNTPIEDSEHLVAPSDSMKQRKRSLAGMIHSVHRPKRLKSRARQRAQNARAGIKLITDFSGLRKPNQQQQKNSPSMTKSKFVDLAALRALEGSPNSASTGSWNWLKRQKSGASPNNLAPSPGDTALSPEDRPIMIGISVDEGPMDGRQISPQTEVLESPPELPRIQTDVVSPSSTAKSTTPMTPSQLRSVWSPDTPASSSTLDVETGRGTSSVYSQTTPSSATVSGQKAVPPVPKVPESHKMMSGTHAPMSVSSDDADTGTPCTLFEEDETPKTAKGRKRGRSFANKNPKQSIVSDTITEWWDEESEAQSPATAVASPRRNAPGTQAPLNTPVVYPSHAHQVNITNNSVVAPTLVSISRAETEHSGEPTPTLIAETSISQPAQEHSQKPAGTQGLFPEKSRSRSRTRAARAQSAVSDVTEICDDQSEPTDQTTMAAGVGSFSRSRRDHVGIVILPSNSPASSARPQRDLALGTAAIQDAHVEESAQSEQLASSAQLRRNADTGDNPPSGSMPQASAAPESQFPPRSGTLAPVQRASSTRSPPPTRTESPARAASPAHSRSPRQTPSPALSQSQGRNESPSRCGTPQLALGAATMSSSDRGNPRRAETRTDSAAIIAGGNGTMRESPPPYSPPRRNLQVPLRFGPIFPLDHPMHGWFPPSPGPVSPAMARTMTSQGAVNMTAIPLTPGPADPIQEGVGRGFVPAEHYGAVESRQDRVERKRLEEERKQQEKERKREEGGGGGLVKMLWRLRNLYPRNQSTAAAVAPAPTAQKKPIWPWVTAGVVTLIILAGVLAGVLTKNGDSKVDDDNDPFVNFPGFPPMPTGVLTVVGPDNSRAEDRCTEPSTLWSCELPPELHDSVAPYKPNQPTVVMQIQFDNTSRASWDVPNGDPPPSAPKSDGSDEDSDARLRRSSTLGRRLSKRLAQGIYPDPKPPSFEEMFFLGDTTDGIVSEDKAGEPTPFYISLLRSADDSVGPNRIDKRSNTISPRQFSKKLPDPEVDEDGTGAPARLLPEARQQPVRLYDRGLPTEHYGFYTYFKRTIYLHSVAANDTDGVARDTDGGAEKEDANFIVTWSETRFLVKLWTKSDSKELLSRGREDGIEESKEMTRPGTMPYPVTMQLDTHGGKASSKFVWAWEVEDGKINADNGKFLSNNIGQGGELFNPRSDGDDSFGGVDGGTGGCRCEWVNFVERRPS